jgi:anti-anti-sigma factor
MEIISGIPVLRPAGRFDSYKVAAIDASMEAIFEEADKPRVVVNLMQVHLIDAAAIEALQKWLIKAQAQGGDIKLSALSQTIRMRLNIQTLAQFLIYEDDQQAIKAFNTDTESDET